MSRPKVGLLGLTLEFYERSGPELRLGRERFVREKLMPALSAVAEVRFDGAVYTREDVEAAVAAMEREPVDAICVVLLSYAPSLIAAPALKRTHLPIVVWNTQELYAVDDRTGQAELTANHGVHGTHDLCNVLTRMGVSFEYVTSHVDDEGAVDELEDVFAAAYTAARLRRARLGLLGYPFPGMGDFGLDTTHLAATLGCAWEALSVPDYVARCAAADAGAIKLLAAEYRDAYDIAPDVSDEDLAAAARAEVALRSMVREKHLDAISYQFLAFGEDPRVETLPFVAASRLLADGVGFGGEGDLISAAGSAMLEWLSGPASFSEMFTIDFEGSAVLLSHMGEANVAMHRSDARPRLVRREKSLVPIRGNQLALAVSFEPGEGTLAALTLGPCPRGGGSARGGSGDGPRWRIVYAPVHIEDFPPLEDLAVPHTKISPLGDVREFLTDYALAGGPHHLAVCFGDAGDRLDILSRMIDAEFYEV